MSQVKRGAAIPIAPLDCKGYLNYLVSELLAELDFVPVLNVTNDIVNYLHGKGCEFAWN